MKTLKSPTGKFLLKIGFALFAASVAQAQTPAEVELVADPRPKHDDRASSQLIANYLTVTGGKDAHNRIRNVVAEGTIKESTLLRNFKLLETYDGRRHLTYFWTHLGRKHRVVYVHDGLETWTQVLEPKELPAQKYGGSDGQHFATLRWLLQPFTLPAKANCVFKYQGADKVATRPVYIVKGYGKKDLPNWFYFDKEKFLLLRWGGKGKIAGVEENMDYRATSFRSVAGVLLPSKIELIAEDAIFGRVTFDRVRANQDLSEFSFDMPKSNVPTLRQRTVPSN